ncbi:MAG: 3-phosphoshikimate 1-carboxyvinyltransferase [Betaproteobacteria bacterium]|nr:3-phosphoshikimate 1-carboxyvinyltransferase [Betaproteobacteria bacterium]
MRKFPSEWLLQPALSAQGQVDLPGSKSLSNRYLLLAALCSGVTELHGLLESDDTAVMLDSLERLGVRLERPAPGVLKVWGVAGAFPRLSAELFVGNSGLTIRTLVPAVAASLSASTDPQAATGTVILSGVPRMHERPIADLVDGLLALGARIDYLGAPGYPPLRLRHAVLRADPIRVRGDTSSQFLTGLLQAAPLVLGSGPDSASKSLVIEIEGDLISQPYVGITLALMARFGVQVEREGWSRFEVRGGQSYRSPGSIAVEGDASSASYFLAAGAIGGGPVRVCGVGQNSVQGDVAFAHALEKMGARITWGPDWIEAKAPADGRHLQGIDLDCVEIPDAAMTLAACALHAEGATLLRGIGSWRVKETDRIAAMATELRKLGARVSEGPDWLRIDPPTALVAASVATYDDHRMAMCLSLASLSSGLRAGVAVTVMEPACVAKTFPDFFDRLAAIIQPLSSVVISQKGASHEFPPPSGGSVPVLTIDGPTASGKGTVAAVIALQLGWHLLDSGALYRVTALAAQQAGVDWADEAAVARIACVLPVRFDAAGLILLDGHDVSTMIRHESIGEGASQVAALPTVRAALLERQRAFRIAPGLIADGRDMGTVVFPDAQAKIFLQASPHERAMRRYKQLIDKGFSANFDDLLQDLHRRDARDSQRAVAPTIPAEDAHVLDSTGLTVDETVAAIRAFMDEVGFPRRSI